MLCSVVVLFMYWDCGVDDICLDSLTLNDGLDGLVHMVVNVFAGNDGGNRVGVLRVLMDALILELAGFGTDASFDVLGVPVIELSVFHVDEIMLVLLGKNLTVGDGLDGGVIMILVDLLVESSLNVFVSLGLDALVRH